MSGSTGDTSGGTEDSNATGSAGVAERYRRRLYEAAEGDGSVAETRDRLLAIGREFLGVENAHVARIDGDDHEIVASVGGDDVAPAVGATLDRATTYCRRTVEADAPVALSNAREQGWADDPAYRAHGLDCYLGASVSVDGDRYGTVCFVSRDAREDQFSASERSFVELVASLLGRRLERRAYRRELEARERRLDGRERAVERAEAALDRSEAKYESLLSTAPDATLLVDAETREIVEANEAAAALTGRPVATLLGTDVLEIQPPGGRDRYRQAFRRARAGLDGTMAELPDGTPIRIRRADGTDVPVEISATTVELDGRRFVHGILRDVSDRKRREQLLTVLNRVLRHNLRNEMNVVAGFAELLAADLDGESAARADRIVDTARELSALGDKARVLETAVEESTRPERVDVAAVTRSVGRELRSSYPSATIRVDAPDELPALATHRIRRAILELGENAVEHGAGEPSVRLAATRKAGGDEEGTVRVRVADDGPGLPADERRLLQSGRETPLDHGSGVGLPLVGWIVTGSGGRVAVDGSCGPGCGADGAACPDPPTDAGTTVDVHLRSPEDSRPAAVTAGRIAGEGD